MKKWTVSETARITGVSVRTLHYYDEIGLLQPSETTEAGYRYYDETALERLEQILFYRELEFTLKDVSEILSRPDYDKRPALMRQRELLALKRQRLDGLIALVDRTMEDETMANQKNAAEAKAQQQKIDEKKREYAQEAAERWGKTDDYRQSQERAAARSEKEDAVEAQERDAIFAAFAENMDKAADSPEALALVDRWRAHITRWHYDCTPQILSGLGQMYAADERFAAALDRFGDGNARFMSEAIACWSKKHL